MIDVVKGTEIELPALLAMWLSLRMSEIRGLKKSDVKDGYLIVQNTMVDVDGKHVVKEQTKTHSSTWKLEVPAYIQGLIDAVDTEYLVTLSGQAIYKRFIRLLEKNGLTHMKFHDLRHTYATIFDLFSQNISLFL